MAYAQVMSALLGAAGLFLLVVGQRQRAGRVRFNSPLGTRTWDTKRSAGAWQAGNRAAGPYTMVMGGVAVACGILGVALTFATEFGGLIAVSIAVVAILVITGIQIRRANEAARHAER